jgi:hypothetical protein
MDSMRFPWFSCLLLVALLVGLAAVDAKIGRPLSVTALAWGRGAAPPVAPPFTATRLAGARSAAPPVFRCPGPRVTAPVADEPGATYFREAHRFLALAAEAADDELVMDVKVDPGLSLDNAVAFGLARHYFQRALDRGHRTAASHAGIGQCLLAVVETGGGVDEPPSRLLRRAEVHFRSCLALAPFDAEAEMGLGRVYHLQVRGPDALFAYRRALRLAPLDARAHMGAALAIIRSGLGSLPDVERHYAFFRYRPRLLERFAGELARCAGVAEDDVDGLLDAAPGVPRVPPDLRQLLALVSPAGWADRAAPPPTEPADRPTRAVHPDAPGGRSGAYGATPGGQDDIDLEL